MIKENNYVHPNTTNYLQIILYFNFLDFYSTAQTLTSDISISTKMDMYHYKIDRTRCEVVKPAFERPAIFTPFCFGSCRVSQQFGGLH
jgi:hypothetical protein